MSWLHWLGGGVVLWAILYFVPVLFDALFDPSPEGFEDVDELARRDQ